MHSVRPPLYPCNTFLTYNKPNEYVHFGTIQSAPQTRASTPTNHISPRITAPLINIL